MSFIITYEIVDCECKNADKEENCDKVSPPRTVLFLGQNSTEFLFVVLQRWTWNESLILFCRTLATFYFVNLVLHTFDAYHYAIDYSGKSFCIVVLIKQLCHNSQIILHTYRALSALTTTSEPSAPNTNRKVYWWK